MNYAVRHAGSPQAVPGLSRAEVLTGLADGNWEPTDEVRADGGTWQALELHPDFAAATEEFEPAPRVEPPDESRIDMNPLIDVALVLLIFFILTTTYETIRKVLDMPGASQSKAAQGVAKGRPLKDFVIQIKARNEGGRVVIAVEGETVRQDELLAKLQSFAKTSGKRQAYVDAEGVDWGTVVTIMDAARAAGIEKTLLKTPEK